MGRPRIYGSDRDKQRAYRARLSAGARFRLDAPTPPVAAVVDHGDPVGALAEWSRKTLIVPPGHARSGEPMALPDFAVKWLTDSWDAHESALSYGARKNAKICDRGGRLNLGYLVRSAEASWMARRDCVSLDKKQGGRAAAPGGGYCPGERS